MQETKIIKVLKTFTPGQIKEFGYFVNSPFYNRVKLVMKLYDAIKKYHPQYKSRFLNKEYVYKKITGKDKYKDDVMRNLYSDLFLLAKEYLCVKGFNNKKFLKETFKISGLKNAIHENKLIFEFEKVKEKLENINFRDENNHYNSFLLMNMRNNNFTHKTVEIFERNINIEITEFVKYFIIHLFDRYFQVNRFKSTYKIKTGHSFLSELSGILTKYGYMDSPIIQIYYNTYMLTQTNGDQYYYNLKKLLNEYLGHLDPYEKIVAFQSMSAFFINRERNGIKVFRKERYEMYKRFVESGDILYNNELLDSYYTNAVAAALLVKEIDWAENFTEKYKNYLPPELREPAYFYNRARILHARKKSEEALAFLARINPTSHTIKAVVTINELQILYDLEMYDSIIDKIDSFRHFISNNDEMSANMRESLNNFLKLYKILTEIKNGNKKYNLSFLKKEIEIRKSSYAKEWIIEKTEEME